MNKAPIITNLIQQACDSGRSLLRAGQILDKEFKVNIWEDPQFAPIFGEIQAHFPIPASYPQLDYIPDDNIICQLRDAVRNGTAREKFPVGTILDDIWMDRENAIVYKMPLIVVDYRIVELASHTRRLGAVLLRQFATPSETVFSENNTNVYSESDINTWLNSAVGLGYIAGCSASLRSAMAKVIVDDDLVVNFFLPSPEELHLNPDGKPQFEDDTWEYFRDTVSDAHKYCSKRDFVNPLQRKRCDCWLRGTPSSETTITAYQLTKHGHITLNVSGSLASSTPACVIA